MTDSFDRFLKLSDQDRRDIFEAAASRLNTLPSYVEKDFWVCLVLDALYNRLPSGHPQLLFKGGTALSKAFDLIHRFSEDIDIVVYRDGLGFKVANDPTLLRGLSKRKRRGLFDQIKEACSRYIQSDLKEALVPIMGEVCSISSDEDDADGQTLLIEYPTLYPDRDMDYVLPRVKLEAGARSALDPNKTASVNPYIADDLSDWPFVYLLLIEQETGRRPPYGVIVLDDDVEHRIENSDEFIRWTNHLIDATRAVRLAPSEPHGATPFPAKCRRCSVNARCAFSRA